MVAPLTWVAVPAWYWTRRAPSGTLALVIPRPALPAAVETLLVATGLAAAAAWVATWRPAAGATATAMLVHALWLAPAEELFFRGYLQGAFAQRLGAWGSALASAACFALTHVLVAGDATQCVTLGPALVFAGLRARQGSVLGAAFCHAVANVSLLAWSRQPG
jgi:membrane protease YdiL (CAAX protease family)